MKGSCPTLSIPFPDGEFLPLGVDAEDSGAGNCLPLRLVQQGLKSIHGHHVDARG